MAEQATTYTNYVFWNDNKGFLILYGALKDALTVKTGFVKWWTDETKETTRKRFTNISADQVHQLLMDDPSARVVKLGKPVPSRMPSPPSGVPTGPPPIPPSAPPSLTPPPPGPLVRITFTDGRFAFDTASPWPAPGSVSRSGPAAVADGAAASPADGIRRGDRSV